MGRGDSRRFSSCVHDLEKSIVPLRQKLNGRLLHQLSRQYNGLAMKPLNSVLKCRAINFLENVGANFDDVVRSHRQEKSVKGRMVQPA